MNTAGKFTLLVLLIVAIAYSHAMADGLLFFDDFKDGTCANWIIDEFGDIEVVDEALCFYTVCEP